MILHKKIKFSVKDFFSRCDQVRRNLRSWSHLLKKWLMENSIFLCSVNKCYYWIIMYFLCSFIQTFSMICISFLTRWHQRNIALSFQVSLIAQQPSVVYVWSRQNILKIFKNDNVIKNVFDSLVGKDICKKLFSVHKKLLLNESKKTSPILYQAPLVTYSTGTLIGILFRCIWLSCPWLSVRYTFSFQKLM